MHEARALLLSLPPAAQTYLRAAVGRKESVNLRKLTRAVYPYVQTLADAQAIADSLASDAVNNLLEVRQRAHPQSAASNRPEVPVSVS
jgi:hypothetical protein